MPHDFSQQLLDAAVDRAPVGMAVFDPELRYLHVNATLAAVNGRPAADHLGRRVTDIVPEVGTELEGHLLRVLETGEPVAGVVVRGVVGGRRQFEASFFPVHANGAVAGVGVVVQEVTERDAALAAERWARLRAERAEGRAGYLAKASAALAGSLDVTATLKTVADLAVPEVADWAFVELVQADGSIRRVTWATADPSLDALAREYDARYPLRADDPAGSAKVIRTGEPELLEEIPEGFLESVTHDPEQLRIIREVGFRSTVIVPLIARGHVLGDLALAYSSSGRRYGPEDLAMLRPLADACALAIDNARLFGEQQATARMLQQSLLPPVLPDIEGVELAARYRPFGSGAEVGGDFYDVFPIPEGWALTIGDVAGKGPAAAATTALVRHSLRIAANLEPGPGAALERLDRALTLGEGAAGRVASAVCVFLRGTEVTVATAGHPPPMLRRADGRVDPAARPGMLLGGLGGPPPEESVHVLGPGDVLLLYTDGVTEARNDAFMLGEEGLAAALESAPPNAHGVATTAERRALEVQDGRPRDDIAVLALGVPV